MSIKTLPPKAPVEMIPITMDFKRLISAPIDTVNMSVSVVSGVDPDVGAMLFGVPQIFGTRVTQIIKSGVNGVKYLVRADATSGNVKFSIAGYLDVIELT